jgi:cytochrome c oxidase subunit 2
MSPLARRQLLSLAAATAGAAALGKALAQTTGGPRVIAMTARRFRYEPSEVILKVGEAVVIEVTSLDLVHGLNIPDLKQRFDLVPGRLTRIPLMPMKAGVIEFVCDNFCGDGHEEMHGRFVVQD